VGFELMRKWGITRRHFPELHALIGVPQDPKWHPEGDVWVHTMLSLDCMSRELRMEDGRWKMEDDKERLKLLFAVLCHDFGKPLTTTIELENGEVVPWQEFQQKNKSISQEIHTNTLHSSLFTPRALLPSVGRTLHSAKRIRAIGHEKAGIEPTRAFLYRLTNEHDFIESILPLVEHHLKPSQFFAQGAKAGAIRRLATKVNIEELVLVAKADHLGRGSGEQGTESSSSYPAGEWLLERASQLQVKERPLVPFLQGRDLILLGLSPSPVFKKILDELYQLQMDGVIKEKEGAIRYVKEHFLE
jgi:tRNA nucleotidyltransferase (CCA-adding enzyme)